MLKTQYARGSINTFLYAFPYEPLFHMIECSKSAQVSLKIRIRINVRIKFTVSINLRADLVLVFVVSIRFIVGVSDKFMVGEDQIYFWSHV